MLKCQRLFVHRPLRRRQRMRKTTKKEKFSILYLLSSYSHSYIEHSFIFVVAFRSIHVNDDVVTIVPDVFLPEFQAPLLLFVYFFTIFRSFFDIFYCRFFAASLHILLCVDAIAPFCFQMAYLTSTKCLSTTKKRGLTARGRVSSVCCPWSRIWYS